MLHSITTDFEALSIRKIIDFEALSISNSSSFVEDQVIPEIPFEENQFENDSNDSQFENDNNDSQFKSTKSNSMSISCM